MENNYDNPIPAIDQIANGNQLQMYKAVIPYLPKSWQRNCILFIKLMEMNNLLTFYSSPLSACDVPEHTSFETLLSELKQYGSETQNQQLDQMLNLFSALKLYQTCQEM